MFPYRLAITDTAEKQLKKLQGKIEEKIRESLQSLKEWRGNIIKMEGPQQEYRLRIGKFRVIFILEDDIIYIIDIGDRKDIYRNRR